MPTCSIRPCGASANTSCCWKSGSVVRRCMPDLALAMHILFSIRYTLTYGAGGSFAPLRGIRLRARMISTSRLLRLTDRPSWISPRMGDAI